jgi:hypothetical protein
MNCSVLFWGFGDLLQQISWFLSVCCTLYTCKQWVIHGWYIVGAYEIEITMGRGEAEKKKRSVVIMIGWEWSLLNAAFTELNTSRRWLEGAQGVTTSKAAPSSLGLYRSPYSNVAMSAANPTLCPLHHRPTEHTNTSFSIFSIIFLYQSIGAGTISKRSKSTGIATK